jgi:hypothetical protein
VCTSQHISHNSGITGAVSTVVTVDRFSVCDMLDSENSPTSVADPAAHAPSPVPTVAGPTAEQSVWLLELSQLRAQEAALVTRLADSSSGVQKCTAELERLSADKEACKEDIKVWSRAFLDANGREPNVQVLLRPVLLAFNVRAIGDQWVSLVQSYSPSVHTCAPVYRGTDKYCVTCVSTADPSNVSCRTKRP